MALGLSRGGKGRLRLRPTTAAATQHATVHWPTAQAHTFPLLLRTIPALRTHLHVRRGMRVTRRGRGRGRGRRRRRSVRVARV
eukprot:53752-Eustigmatos_ZCMA.PRE.1